MFVCIRLDVPKRRSKSIPRVEAIFLNFFQSLLQKTFRERRSLLQNSFSPYTPEEIGFARFTHVESMNSEVGQASVEVFWRRSIESQCEGLMIKVSLF